MNHPNSLQQLNSIWNDTSPMLNGGVWMSKKGTTNLLDIDKNYIFNPNYMKPGAFIIIINPKYMGDYGQIIDVNWNKGKALIKLIPRINYRDIHAFKVKTQTSLNNILGPNAKIPLNLFDSNIFVSEQKKVKIKISWAKNGYIDGIKWDGDKFINKFLYKRFYICELRTVNRKIPENIFQLFTSNIAEFEHSNQDFKEKLHEFEEKNEEYLDSDIDLSDSNYDLGENDLHNNFLMLEKNFDARISKLKSKSNEKEKEKNEKEEKEKELIMKTNEILKKQNLLFPPEKNQTEDESLKTNSMNSMNLMNQVNPVQPVNYQIQLPKRSSQRLKTAMNQIIANSIKPKNNNQNLMNMNSNLIQYANVMSQKNATEAKLSMYLNSDYMRNLYNKVKYETPYKSPMLQQPKIMNQANLSQPNINLHLLNSNQNNLPQQSLSQNNENQLNTNNQLLNINNFHKLNSNQNNLNKLSSNQNNLIQLNMTNQNLNDLSKINSSPNNLNKLNSSPNALIQLVLTNKNMNDLSKINSSPNDLNKLNSNPNNLNKLNSSPNDLIQLILTNKNLNDLSKLNSSQNNLNKLNAVQLNMNKSNTNQTNMNLHQPNIRLNQTNSNQMNVNKSAVMSPIMPKINQKSNDNNATSPNKNKSIPIQQSPNSSLTNQNANRNIKMPKINLKSNNSKELIESTNQTKLVNSHSRNNLLKSPTEDNIKEQNRKPKPPRIHLHDEILTKPPNKEKLTDSPIKIKPPRINLTKKDQQTTLTTPADKTKMIGIEDEIMSEYYFYDWLFAENSKKIDKNPIKSDEQMIFQYQKLLNKKYIPNFMKNLTPLNVDKYDELIEDGEIDDFNYIDQYEMRMGFPTDNK